MSDLPQRKHNRLIQYDYSSNGAYFVTMCVKDKHEMLGCIPPVGADIIRPHTQTVLSQYGLIVDSAINTIRLHYPYCVVEKYCIMPNHIHIILFIVSENVSRADNIRPYKDISTIIGQMKRWASKQIGFSLWQKSFHDHIIRNGQEYQKIWQYIDENPMNWEDDCFYPKK